MRLRRLPVVAALALLFAPATARADWLVTPFIGTNWSSNATTEHPIPFGASLAYMGGGIIGVETQFVYTRDFYGSGAIGSNNVFSWMANVIVGAPIGGRTQIRPYAVGGAGLLRQRIGASGDLFDITANDFGMDVGGGVMAFFNPNIGVRGDVRYYRSLNGANPPPFALDLGRFHYWEGTIGVAFRF